MASRGCQLLALALQLPASAAGLAELHVTLWATLRQPRARSG